MTWSFVGGHFVEGLAFDVCKICGRPCPDCGHLKGMHHTGNRPGGGCPVKGCRCRLTYFTDGALISVEIGERAVTGDSPPKPDASSSTAPNDEKALEPPLLTKPGD